MRAVCRYTVLIILIGLSLTGCFASQKEIKAKENKIAKVAQKYLEEKYNMSKPIFEGVSLIDKNETSGPIPDFDVEVPDDGVVSFKYKDKAFKVIVSTGWSKKTYKFGSIVADNYQSDEIKNIIEDKIINKYAITSQFNIKSFEVSSLTGDENIGYNWPSKYVFDQDYNGIQSFFGFKCKFSGNIEKFLKENDISIKLDITFASNKNDNYLPQIKKLFNEIVKHFGKGESEISVSVDNTISFHAYTYCSISGKTHSSKFIEYQKRNYKDTKTKRLEVKVYNPHYIPISNGISLSSKLANVEFSNKNDFKCSIKQMTGTDTYSKTDFITLNKNLYGILNDTIYNVSYAKNKYSGEEVSWSDPISIKVDKNIVPNGVENLYIVLNLSNGKLSPSDEGPFVKYGDSFIGNVRTKRDFVIVYKK